MLNNSISLNLQPEISVLMPVFNGEKFLLAALQSVMAQTFKNWELLIIDDGSTDRSKEIAQSMGDSRLRWIQTPKRLGLVESLNYGLTLTSAELVARMDCDDICVPERLQKQFDFLRANPDIDVVGSDLLLIDTENQYLGRPPPMPETSAAIFFGMFRECCLFHPAVLFRRNSILAVQGYDAKDRYAEDFSLWLRLLRQGKKLANLSEPLLKYRKHGSSLSQKHAADLRDHHLLLVREHIEWYLQRKIEPRFLLPFRSAKYIREFKEFEGFHEIFWAIYVKSCNDSPPADLFWIHRHSVAFYFSMLFFAFPKNMSVMPQIFARALQVARYPKVRSLPSTLVDQLIYFVQYAWRRMPMGKF